MKYILKKYLSMLMVFAMLFGFSNGLVLAEEKVTTSTITEEKEPIENVIDILTLNDFHGSVKENGKNIGMVKMVGYINEQKQKNPNTIIVSAGDSYQGTALSNLTYGAPVSEMYKAMGVVASAVGNHEFDWGVERIAQWSKEGGFPFLVSNIYDKATNAPVSWAKPYHIQEVAGKKIAFIGLSTVETAYKTKVENVASLEFKAVDEAAKIWIDYLKAGKAEEGTPDVIIALTHISANQDNYGTDTTLPVTGDELETLCAVEGLDAVITGHSHTTVAGYVNDIPVVQAYKNGRTVGKLSIELTEDQTIKTITPSVADVYKLSSDLVEDADAKVIYDKYEAEFAPIANEVIGKLEGTLTHDRSNKNVSALGYWSCDVMRKATGTQIGLTNGGGLRRTLKEGDVTMGDMYEIMPFDNQLVTMEVTGAHLKALINHGIEAESMTDGQFAGLKVEYDLSKEYENRIVSMTLEDGTPIDMDATYTLVTNDFVLTGGDGYDFAGATNVVDTFVPIRDELVKAFKEAGTIVAPEVNVITAITTQEVPTASNEEVIIYTIQYGDVLWKIAEKYDLTYEELAEMNELENPHVIYVGDTLIVPAQ